MCVVNTDPIVWERPAIFLFEGYIALLCGSFIFLALVDTNAGNSWREVVPTHNSRSISVGTTALQREHRVHMSKDFYRAGIQLSRSLSSSLSLHGGRGAAPSEGGRPSDLSALAGGGFLSNFHHGADP